MKENPLPSPFFAIYEGAVKAFNAVGDSYAALPLPALARASRVSILERNANAAPARGCAFVRDDGVGIAKLESGKTVCGPLAERHNCMFR